MLTNLYIFFTGILMGIADTLPGISGSTITYILGLYEKFIKSINDLTKKETFIEAFVFLFKLGLGWIIGAVASILLISNFANNNIYFITSLFLGLIVAMIVLTYRDLNKKDKMTLKSFLFMFLGFYVTIVIFFFGWGVINLFSGPMLYVYAFLIGIIAISCMLLPGISGSSILVIFGVYAYTINTIGNILKGDFSDSSYLFVLILGILVGIFTCARLVTKLFENHEIITFNIIIGILLGSIIPIIYTPLTLEDTKYNALNFSNVSYFGILLGIVILFALNRIKILKERTEG